MTDFDLEARLKSVCLPDRPDAYWADFPSRVRVQLRRESGGTPPRSGQRFRIARAFEFALAAALIFICVQYHPLQATSAAVARHARDLHRQVARLDAGLHRLVLNTDGMAYLLTEAN